MGMRQKSWRVVSVGALLLMLAVGYFIVMMGVAPHSNDPEKLMQTVGEVSGVVGGVSLMMLAIGLIGRPVGALVERE